MQCTIRTILELPYLEDASLLAGRNFLDNIINRLSVFDCPVKESMLDKNIIEHGDLFLSGLDQFKNDPDMFSTFISLLIDNRCSALIVTDENPHLITPDIITKCDTLGLPLIMVNHDIPYAAIMDAIHQLSIQQYYHAVNGSKLDSLKTNKLNDMEKKRILDSINPKFSTFICLITVQGMAFSSMTGNDLTSTFLNRPKDAYIFHDNIHYFMLSNETKLALQKTVATFRGTLNKFFSSYTAGISSIHSKVYIDICFEEAELATDTAFYLRESQVEYDNSSLLQLILKLKDTNALYRYHDSLLSTINAYKSENDTTLFDTLRQYVLCKGSYHDTAEAMGQHESTIRYRINRLRQILDLEDDIIQFHACISMLVIIDTLIPRK